MIHDEHPFAPEPADRDPTRRFRGRLAAPVTIVTAGDGERMTGLTVSSVIVVEGDPGVVEMVVGPATDLWGAVAETNRFVIHVCRTEDRHLAEVFAGLRPSPGGIFAGVEIVESDWGPVLAGVGDRAFCTLRTRNEIGLSGVVTGTIDQIETTALTDPLLYFRGGYRGLV